MIAFVFPGQGSQRRGMGQDVFDCVREYAELEPQVDAILGYSLRQLCVEDKDRRLNETQYTQPSLYVLNALYYYKAFREGRRPDYLAGHSLGEYNALHAAGVFDFLTGLRLVKKRGELMALARNGGMGAVIGLGAETIAKVIEDAGLCGLDLANFNTPLQTVVSGPVDEIKRAGPVFEKAGARLFMPLPVSAAFHSRYMNEVAQSFAEWLGPLSFAAPQLPVIANATAQPYSANGADNSKAVKSLLVKQITHGVQWTQTVRMLLDRGVAQFDELGPGNVLTKLVQQIQQEHNS